MFPRYLWGVEQMFPGYLRGGWIDRKVGASMMRDGQDTYLDELFQLPTLNPHAGHVPGQRGAASGARRTPPSLLGSPRVVPPGSPSVLLISLHLSLSLAHTQAHSLWYAVQIRPFSVSLSLYLSLSLSVGTHPSTLEQKEPALTKLVSSNRPRKS